MDENKIVKLNIKHENKQGAEKPPKAKFGFMQTNPIIKEMFFANMFNKKNKFSIKDLFRL